MFIQNTPPDTTAYMIAGFLLFTLIMVVYLASLVIRRRNLLQDLNMLELITVESKALPAKVPTARRVTLRRKPAATGRVQRRRVLKKATRKK
jgi:hypothetical protein